MITHPGAIHTVSTSGAHKITFGERTFVPTLLGVVGSHAYGLNHGASDTDLLGLFIEPTINLLGLRPPRDCYDSVGKQEDIKLYELGKAIPLMMSGNPSVLELLFLENYVQLLDDGAELVANRDLFLGADRIREAYGGYVLGQAKRLVSRDGSFSADTKNRTTKHARHCLRLLDQAHQLLTTGTLNVRVADPEALLTKAELSQSDPQAFLDQVTTEVSKLNDLPSTLPHQVDYAKINQLMISLRLRHLS